MSKRKNTLNDLEEFLKLQASTLVAPKPVETPIPSNSSQQVLVVKEEREAIYYPSVQTPAQPLDLLEEMKKLASENKRGFYDFIIEAIESNATGNKNDILLINTALYLKHGDNWKRGIEEYWSSRKVNG